METLLKLQIAGSSPLYQVSRAKVHEAGMAVLAKDFYLPFYFSGVLYYICLQRAGSTAWRQIACPAEPWPTADHTKNPYKSQRDEQDRRNARAAKDRARLQAF